MSGQRVGYVRVSTFDQNPDRQLENVQVDRVFTDKASGKDTTRPQLQALLQHLSPMGWEHINLTGDYVWRQNKQVETGRFRPLWPIPPEA